MRGKDVTVRCSSCGRTVARSKAVEYEKGISIGTDMHTADDVRFFEKRKIYYCISCAKHRGIFQRKKEQAERKGRGRF